MTPSSKNKVWEALTLPADMEPNPEYGDLYDLEDWIHYVQSGAFIDYDGYGNMATESSHLPRVNVYPSKAKHRNFEFPAWVTHIVWYNR